MERIEFTTPNKSERLTEKREQLEKRRALKSELEFRQERRVLNEQIKEVWND